MLGGAVTRGGHRTASVASLAAKENNIQKELAHLRLQADDLQLEHDIACIVRELRTGTFQQGEDVQGHGGGRLLPQPSDRQLLPQAFGSARNIMTHAG